MLIVIGYNFITLLPLNITLLRQYYYFILHVPFQILIFFFILLLYLTTKLEMPILHAW